MIYRLNLNLVPEFIFRISLLLDHVLDTKFDFDAKQAPSLVSAGHQGRGLGDLAGGREPSLPAVAFNYKCDGYEEGGLHGGGVLILYCLMCPICLN